MPNFSIPNQINPGDPLDATKAMANWNQIVNDLNAGKIDETNLTAAVVGATLGLYRTVADRVSDDGNFPVAGAANTFGLGQGAHYDLSTITAHSSKAAFRIDPADYPASSNRTAKMRVIGTGTGNGTAWGATLPCALYKVANYGGGVGDSHIVLGAQVGASSLTLADPGVNPTSASSAASADFAVPAAGDYVLCVTGASGNANASTTIRLALQVHWT